MEELNDKEEIKKLRILEEIYLRENEQLKYEYRVLHDRYMLQVAEVEKYEKRLCIRAINAFKSSIIGRVLRKIKNVIKKG